MANSRRLKIVRIGKQTLVDLLRLDGTRAIRIEGLPPDAKLVGVSDLIRFDSDELAFKFESDSFAEVPEYNSIPLLYLEFHDGVTHEKDF